MKLPAQMLCGSLVLNTGLLALLVLHPNLAPPAIQPYLGGEPSAADRSNPAFDAAKKIRASTRVLSTSGQPATVWSKFNVSDLKSLAAQLRGAGFPTWAIRAILQTQINSQYLARMRELTAPDPNLPYWKSSPNSYLGLQGDRLVEYSRLARERTQILKDILGDFMYRDDGDISAAERQRYGGLSRAKINALDQINRDYSEMTTQVRAAMNNITLPEDREKLALLERERKADIAAALTPEEFADYEVRNSPITMRLRGQLTVFQASEAEFQAIYRANQPYEDVLYPGVATPGMTQARMEERQAAIKAVAEQLRATLGEARYAEYARAGDREFQQLVGMMQAAGNPIKTAIDAYALRQQVSVESNRIGADASMNVDAKRAALQQLAASTRAQMVATLGPTAGQSYLQVAERWIGALERGQSVTFTENGMSYRSVAAPPRPGVPVPTGTVPVTPTIIFTPGG